MTKRTLRLGTRGSRLALTQTNQIADQLRQSWPALEVETVIIHTTGDKILDSSLSKIGGKGLFTKEIEQALLDCQIDVAVHSLKDLPTQQPPGLALGAISQREAANDLLLAKEPLDWKALGPEHSIGTSSLRRRAQIMAGNPRVQVRDLRGNVPTRIRRMMEGEYTAIVLAAAGVARLGEAAPFTAMIPFDEMLPAPGQGALGLQIRDGDEPTRELLSPVNDPEATICCSAEREVLHAVGGGCQLPLGTHATIAQNAIQLAARIASLDGANVIDDRISGPTDQWRSLAQTLSKRMIEKGGGVLLAAVATDLATGYEDAKTRAGALRQGPLGNLTILVTRDEDTDGPLSRALRAQGADPLCMPLVQHLPPSDAMPLVGAASSIDEFDWLVFTSARGVDAFADAIEARGRQFSAVTTPIACVGGATARRVSERGASAQLIPDEASGAALVAAFAAVCELSGKSVLFPRSEQARPTVSEGLARLGASVTDPVAYRTVPHPAAGSIVTELRAGRVHGILFTSASAAEALAGILAEPDFQLLKSLTIGAIGEVTAAALREHGINTNFIPPESSFESLVEALVKHHS